LRSGSIVALRCPCSIPLRSCVRGGLEERRAFAPAAARCAVELAVDHEGPAAHRAAVNAGRGQRSAREGGSHSASHATVRLYAGSIRTARPSLRISTSNVVPENSYQISGRPIARGRTLFSKRSPLVGCKTGREFLERGLDLWWHLTFPDLEFQFLDRTAAPRSDADDGRVRFNSS
jgi:hypothetical protein